MSYHTIKKSIEKLEQRVNKQDNKKSYTSRIDTGEPYEYPPGSRVLVIDVSSGEAKNYDY